MESVTSNSALLITFFRWSAISEIQAYDQAQGRDGGRDRRVCGSGYSVYEAELYRFVQGKAESGV